MIVSGVRFTTKSRSSTMRLTASVTAPPRAVSFLPRTMVPWVLALGVPTSSSASSGMSTRPSPSTMLNTSGSKSLRTISVTTPPTAPSTWVTSIGCVPTWVSATVTMPAPTTVIPRAPTVTCRATMTAMADSSSTPLTGSTVRPAGMVTRTIPLSPSPKVMSA